nr:hypothetical protein [uncultured Arthrobacter sp.]
MLARTVLGSVELDPARAVLPHEHLVIDYNQKEGRASPPLKETEDACVEALQELPSLGIQAIVDCTPPGYGRDLAFLRQVSSRSGVHIIASTGTFCEQWSPQPSWAQKASVQELVDAFTAEIDRGCGVIKVATSHGTASDNEIKALKAAALTHRGTGVPIVSHTTGSLGLEQVLMYEELGVELSKVLISHVCADEEPIDYALAIARRGAYVGLDRIGHASHPDKHWISIIQRFLDEGLENKVLLSHDSVQTFAGPDAIAGHTFRNIRHLPTTFHKNATCAGITENTLRQLTVHNPLRWLEPNRVS